MSSFVARPTFYEGEILPAGALAATVEYPRDQVARHDRYHHTRGIAAGLETKPGKAATDTSGKAYNPVTVTAGGARDGTGREIVVADDVDLNPEDFIGEVNPLPPTTKPVPWYPVFLNGLDQAGQISSNLTGACSTSQPTRMKETYSISFGLPGSELNLDQQQAVNVADPPGDGTNNPWKVLVGFVQWSADANNFADAAPTNDDNEGPRYVGLNAARVTSQSGALLLSTHPAGFAGKNPVMAVEIEEADKDGKLVFGKLNPDGSVNPVLTVAANGDLTASGQISGAVTPGSMQVQSGIAFDGMILPLPTGIDPSYAAAGKITVHTHVAFHYESLNPPHLLVAVPIECRVYVSTRRVHCRAVDVTAGPPAVNVLPALCN